jgi:hypothetical protein
MNSKSFLILTLLAGLAALGAWFLAFRPAASPPPGASDAADQRLAPALVERADAIASITIDSAGREGGPVRLERDESGAWRLASKAGFPAEADRVRRLITTLSELRTVEPKTTNPELYDRLAVQWPDTGERDADDFSARPTLVTIADDAGEPITRIVLGDTAFSGGQSRQYARLLTDDRSWLVSGAVTIPFGPLGFANTRFVELPRDSVRSVTIAHPNGEILELTRDDPEGDFVVANIPEGMAMTNQALANNTGNALAFVNFTDIELGGTMDVSGDGNPFPKDAISAVYTTFDGAAVTLAIEPETAENGGVEAGWVSVHNATGEGSDEILARFATNPLRFKLPAGAIESLTRRPSELLEETAPETAGPSLPEGPGLPPPTDG